MQSECHAAIGRGRAASLRRGHLRCRPEPGGGSQPLPEARSDAGLGFRLEFTTQADQISLPATGHTPGARRTRVKPCNALQILCREGGAEDAGREDNEPAADVIVHDDALVLA